LFDVDKIHRPFYWQTYLVLIQEELFEFESKNPIKNLRKEDLNHIEHCRDLLVDHEMMMRIKFVTFFEDEMHYLKHIYQRNKNPNHVKILMKSMIDDINLVQVNGQA
jgi:hypothetical protein